MWALNSLRIAARLKSSIFWDTTLCSPLKDARYLLQAAFLLGLFFDLEDRDDMSLRNIG
jgi:hypothetical protein